MQVRVVPISTVDVRDTVASNFLFTCLACKGDIFLLITGS